MYNTQVLTSIKNEALSVVNSHLQNFSAQELQAVFVKAICMFDYFFEKTTYAEESQGKKDAEDIIYFGYPALIDLLYGDFQQHESVALDTMQSFNETTIDIIDACQIVGRINSLLEDLHCDFLKVTKSTDTVVHLSPVGKYSWIERFENELTVSYSNALLEFQKSDYAKLGKRHPSIVAKMKPLVYRWNENYS